MTQVRLPEPVLRTPVDGLDLAGLERLLLPALRAGDPDTVVLADGFSCRTQIHELGSGGREAVHLAELLERGVRDRARTVPGDLEPGDRPAAPPSAARVSAPASAAAVGLAGAALGARAVTSRVRRP